MLTSSDQNLLFFMKYIFVECLKIEETLFDLIETSGQGTQMLCGPDLKRVLTSNE